MKIAVVGAKGLPAKQGGIEHYCAEVYPRIVAKGHSVDLFARSSYTNDSWFESYDFSGVNVISVPGLNQKGMDAFISSALGSILSGGNRYDIVHFHALGPALFSWLPKIGSSAKIVVSCQGLDWQRAKWGTFSSHLIRLGERAAARFADEIIVVSKELGAYFLSTYDRSTHYIPNAPAGYVDSDQSSPLVKSLGLTPQKYIVFLGRLVPEKQPDLLIEAFCRLKPEGWKLAVVGGTSDTDEFMAKLQAMQAQCSDVLLVGELTGARLAEVVRGAGLFVLPSNLEGLPLAMLEAMLEGIPIVASDIPPHRQLVGENRGVMFRVGDVNSCMESLNWATQHMDEMNVMAERAKAHVQLNYNWDQITADTLNLYNTLLTKNHVINASQRDYSKPAEVAERR